MKKIIAKILSATLISLLVIGSISSSVFATRTPDNTDASLTSQIPTTDDLSFDNAPCNLSSVPDLTNTYASYILDSTKYDSNNFSTSTINDIKASYEAAVADLSYGTWAVSYGHNYRGNLVNVSWTRDPSAHLQWLNNPYGTYDYQEIDLVGKWYDDWSNNYSM